MQTLVYVKPLKAGKLEAYKKFCATNAGPRKAEYSDLLKRYGLNNTRVFNHHIEGKDYIIIVHDGATDDAVERLSKWAQSDNPYDHWFGEQLVELHGAGTDDEAAQSELLLDFET